MSNVSFAEDVLAEILSRLPVKSLLRFRCVCKEWHRFIQSAAFISKHFNRETNHSCLLVGYESPGCRPRPYHYALFPDTDLSGTPPFHEDIYIYEQLEDMGEIFGPVNGLFFVHIKHFGLDDDMALWNPATRKLKLISYPKPEIPSHWELNLQQFGFGIDSFSNDYKIIWFRSYCDREEDVSPCGDTEVTIYSFSKDSWSSPLITDSSPFNSLGNTFLNGAYYWLSENWIDFYSCCYSILSFDMASEVFRDIEGPGNVKGSMGSRELMLYNDHLALLISDYCSHDQWSFYVWIMQEEGYWIKLLSIGPFQDVRLAVGIWKNDEILIPTGKSGRLLLYNANSSKSKDLGLQCNPGDSFFRTYSYKESLVSVNGGDEVWELVHSHKEQSKSFKLEYFKKIKQKEKKQQKKLCKRIRSET